MAIRYRNLIGAAILVGATTLITTQVTSRQTDPTPEEMWEAWMKYAQPGPEHAQLAKMTGMWHQETSHWTHPGAEPQRSESVASFRPILGGRFMVENVRGQMEMNGEQFSFEGMGIMGYDNYRKKHVFAWMDNMGTLIMLGEGEADATGKVITYYSDMPNPATGQSMQFKSVSREVDDDNTVFEMYDKRGDTWFKNTEIVSARTSRSGWGAGGPAGWGGGTKKGTTKKKGWGR